MYRAIVLVFDKRCDSGINTRGKNFETKDECIAWAKSIHNRVRNTVMIIHDSIAVSVKW